MADWSGFSGGAAGSAGSSGATGATGSTGSTGPSWKIATLEDIRDNAANGGSAPATTNIPRRFNTVVDPEGVGVTLTTGGSTNTDFELDSGTYYFDICCPIYGIVNAYECWLVNLQSATTTIGSAALIGMHGNNLVGQQGEAKITGRVTITTHTSFQVINKVQTQDLTGTALGRSHGNSVNNSTAAEHYSKMTIIKLG